MIQMMNAIRQTRKIYLIDFQSISQRPDCGLGQCNLLRDSLRGRAAFGNSAV
jgi:hypothetical protein